MQKDNYEKMMQVSHEYEHDSSNGWVEIDIGDSHYALIVIHSDKYGSRGFSFNKGEMQPQCICEARSEDECLCENVGWGED